MTILKTLYRRGTDFSIDNSEHIVQQNGSTSFTWTFRNPGWVSFDYLALVPSNAANDLADKYFEVYVNGIRRFRVRGPWAWTRQWIFVDAGTHTVQFRKVNYGSGDTAKIRRINLTDFPKAEEPHMLEATTMPKPLENISTFPLLMGWQRYQRSGPKGCELEFTLIFQEMEKWQSFMANLENFYIIKGDYGVYGGTILPQDCDTVRKGTLILMKCKMQSPMKAGVGVNGE